LTIIDKFNDSSIVEMQLNDGTASLVLKKAGAFGSKEGMPTESAGHPSPKNSETGIVRLSLPVQLSDEKANGETIISPIVATFYASPSPDAPPFVSPGTKAKAGDTLCILEAMKMMNHLEAEFDCEIISVNASSGDMVEYGQSLFTVKRL
ncbi:MAG: acetyl-CoA carboxylase biotin carboxyl carrier protein, partial [Treponema sp.]|nr:acetyl-CoA carboxylase biotin carboxyl carrier protein [Treponema sp.]